MTASSLNAENGMTHTVMKSATTDIFELSDNLIHVNLTHGHLLLFNSRSHTFFDVKYHKTHGKILKGILYSIHLLFNS